jgi:hypothetical protein
MNETIKKKQARDKGKEEPWPSPLRRRVAGSGTAIAPTGRSSLATPL